MKLRKLSLSALCLVGALAFAANAYATTIDMFTSSLTAKDPTQSGRLSRTGIMSDWSSTKSFPGFINTGTTYHYTTYVYTPTDLVDAPYIQIDVDSISINTFFSAYAGSYDPTNPSAGYLGDAGASGNFFGIDPISFQIIIPAGEDLVIVANNTGASNLGVGDPYTITVEAFADTEFTDPSPISSSPIPEPSTLVLFGSGLVGLAGAVRRKLLAA